MIRVGPVSRASSALLALAFAVAAAGCIPTLPRLWSPNPPVGPETPPDVSPSAGGPAGDPQIETMQVTAAPPPKVEVDVIAAPSERARPPPQVAARPSGDEVIVPAGKTLYAIAREHDVAVRDLIELNRLDPPYRLLAGQRLKLPTERSYLVQSGDTLYGVARRMGVDLHVLVQRNRLAPPYKLVSGTRLKLPSPTEPLAEPMEAAPTAVASATLTPIPPKPPTRPLAETSPQPERKAAAPASDQTKLAGSRSARIIEPPPRAGASFFWPVRGRVVSQFGRQGGGVQHDGIAIAVPRGTPVKASENGVVAYAGSDLKAYGKLLLVRHAGGWMTAYAHNDKLLVREGDVVRRGQTIAQAGSSGSVRDPQTYFEIRHQGKPVDPMSHLTKS